MTNEYAPGLLGNLCFCLNYFALPNRWDRRFKSLIPNWCSGL